MFKDNKAFSGFSVNDLVAAKKFYNETLGLDVTEDQIGLTLKLPGGNQIFVYPKKDHQPATYTMLNFVVSDIDKAVTDLTAKGVTMEHYDNLDLPAAQDDKGVLRGLAAKMGPDIAWFKDPAGNVIAIMQEA